MRFRVREEGGETKRGDEQGPSIGTRETKGWRKAGGHAHLALCLNTPSCKRRHTARVEEVRGVGTATSTSIPPSPLFVATTPTCRANEVFISRTFPSRQRVTQRLRGGKVTPRHLFPLRRGRARVSVGLEAEKSRSA